MMLSRRSLLAGLIAAPLVVANSKVLMPIKEIIPEYGMYVKGVWADGSAFNIGIEHGYSAADIGGMDWFGMVKRVDAVEYTDQKRKDLVDNQSVIFDPYRRYDRDQGKPMLPWHERGEKRWVHRKENTIYTLSELKQKGFVTDAEVEMATRARLFG